MKQQLNEFKRMQLLAGLITESEYQESQVNEISNTQKEIEQYIKDLEWIKRDLRG